MDPAHSFGVTIRRSVPVSELDTTVPSRSVFACATARHQFARWDDSIETIHECDEGTVIEGDQHLLFIGTNGTLKAVYRAAPVNEAAKDYAVGFSAPGGATKYLISDGTFASLDELKSASLKGETVKKFSKSEADKIAKANQSKGSTVKTMPYPAAVDEGTLEKMNLANVAAAARTYGYHKAHAEAFAKQGNKEREADAEDAMDTAKSKYTKIAAGTRWAADITKHPEYKKGYELGQKHGLDETVVSESYFGSVQIMCDDWEGKLRGPHGDETSMTLTFPDKEKFAGFIRNFRMEYPATKLETDPVKRVVRVPNKEVKESIDEAANNYDDPEAALDQAIDWAKKGGIFAVVTTQSGFQVYGQKGLKNTDKKKIVACVYAGKMYGGEDAVAFATDFFQEGGPSPKIKSMGEEYAADDETIVEADGEDAADSKAAMSKSNTINAQIGAKAFFMMGAKDRMGGILTTQDGKKLPGLSFKIGKNAKGVSHIRIFVLPSDEYLVEYLKVRGTTVKVAAKSDGIQADQLRSDIEANTGLYLSLGTMSAKPKLGESAMKPADIKNWLVANCAAAILANTALAESLDAAKTDDEIIEAAKAIAKVAGVALPEGTAAKPAPNAGEPDGEDENGDGVVDKKDAKKAKKKATNESVDEAKAKKCPDCGKAECECDDEEEEEDEEDDEEMDESVVKAVAPLLLKASQELVEDDYHTGTEGQAYRGTLRRLAAGIPIKESDAATKAKRDVRALAKVEEAKRVEEAKGLAKKPFKLFQKKGKDDKAPAKKDDKEPVDEAFEDAALINLRKAAALLKDGDPKGAEELVKKAIANLSVSKGNKVSGESSAKRLAISAAVKECVEKGILDEAALNEYMEVASNSISTCNLKADETCPVSVYNGTVNLSYEGFFAKVPHYGVADFLIQNALREAIKDGALDSFVADVRARLANSPKVAALEVELAESEAAPTKPAVNEAAGAAVAKPAAPAKPAAVAAPSVDEACKAKGKEAAKKVPAKIAKMAKEGKLKLKESVVSFPHDAVEEVSGVLADLGLSTTARVTMSEGIVNVDITSAKIAVDAFFADLAA